MAGRAGGWGVGARADGRGKPLFRFPPDLWLGCTARYSVELARCARCLPLAGSLHKNVASLTSRGKGSSPSAATPPTWPAPRCRQSCHSPPPSPPPSHTHTYLPEDGKTGPVLAASLKLTHSLTRSPSPPPPRSLPSTPPTWPSRRRLQQQVASTPLPPLARCSINTQFRFVWTASKHREGFRLPRQTMTQMMTFPGAPPVVSVSVSLSVC